jgi:hypothetical protein
MVIILLAVSPRCKPGTEQMSVGALNMHSMQVKCEVEADPADSVKFHWTYNNTRNVSPVSTEATLLNNSAKSGNSNLNSHFSSWNKIKFYCVMNASVRWKIILILSSSPMSNRS